MVAKNQPIAPISVETEAAKLSEQTPDTEKAGIVANTQGTLGRFGVVLGFTVALNAPVFAQPLSPYEPIVDASGNPPLVLREDIAKTDLFATFERNGKTEKKEIFTKLPAEQQKKVLSYYQIGKNEQPNEKVLMKGVYNLMNYYINLKINEDALAQYKQTGKLPDVELPAVCGNALLVVQ